MASKGKGRDRLYADAFGPYSMVDDQEREAHFSKVTSSYKAHLDELHRYRVSLLEDENLLEKKYANARDKITKDYLKDLEKEPKLTGLQKKLKEAGSAFGKQAAEDFKKEFGEVTEDLQEDFNKMYAEVAKEASGAYEKHMSDSVGKIAGKMKQVFTLVYEDLWKNYGQHLAGMASYGKIDIGGNLAKGSDMAYNFRKEYGNYGLSQTSVLADSITQSYKDLKREGIISDPEVQLKSLQTLRSMVSIGSLSQDRLAQLLSTTTKISESVLGLDMSSAAMQYAMGSLGANVTEEMIGRAILASRGTQDSVYSEALVNKLLSNDEYMASAIYSFGDQSTKMIEDTVQAFSALGGYKGMNASTIGSIQDLYAAASSGSLDLNSNFFLSALGKGGVSALSNAVTMQNPEEFISTILQLTSTTDILNLLSSTAGQSVLTSSGLNAGMTAKDLKILATAGIDPDEFKVNARAAMGVDYTAEDAQETLAQLTDKYTSIDKTNLDTMFKSWSMGSDNYEKDTLQGIAKILGYMDEFLPYTEKIFEVFSGGGSSGGLLEGLISGATSGAIIKSGLALPKVAGLGSILGTAGPIALGVGSVALGMYAISEENKRSTDRIVRALSPGDPGVDEGNALTVTSEVDPTTGKVTYTTEEVPVEEANETNQREKENYDQRVQNYLATTPYKTMDEAYSNYKHENAYTVGAGGFILDRQQWEARALGDEYDMLHLNPIGYTENVEDSERNSYVASNDTYNIYSRLGLLPKSDLWGETHKKLYKYNNIDWLRSEAKSGRYYDLTNYMGWTPLKDKKLEPMSFDKLVSDAKRGSSGSLTALSNLLGRDVETISKYLFDENSPSDSWVSLAERMGLNLSTGLSNVPYNGMPALLHQGEMVLPSGKANFIRMLFGQKPVPGSGVPETQLTGNNSFVQSLPNYLQTGPISNGDSDPGIFGSFAAGDDAISYAKQYLGQFNYNRDRREDPGYFDCSSLVARSYREGAGIGVGIPTAAGIGEGFPSRGFGVMYQGGRLTKSQTIGLGLKSGDILLYDLNDTNNGRFMDIDHAAMAYNSTQQLHTSNPNKPVRIEDIWNKAVMVLRYGAGGEGLNPLYSGSYTTRGGSSFGGSSGGGLLSYLLGLYGMGGPSTVGGISTDGISDSSGYYSNTYKPLLDKYAGLIGINPRLFYGMMMTESSGRPNLNQWEATQYKGLMQVNQDVINRYVGLGSNIYDPENNIKAAAYHLQSAIQKTGYTSLGIGGYNAGPNYTAWQTARAILDSGGDWSTILSKMRDVGNRDELMKGNPNNIKTSYIRSVYKHAGIPLQVPFLEHGGVVSDPTLLVAGEGQNPEAITPLDEDRNLLGLMDMTTNIVDSLDLNTAKLIKKLEEIVSALGRSADSIGMEYATSRNNLRSFGVR